MTFTPYQIVVVTTPYGQFNGQVMSYETPEKTVMVRNVPGHPGTLVERQVCVLRAMTPAESGKYRWVHYAKVAGRGQFPVDMLRYDWCAPVNFTIEEREGLRGYLVASAPIESFGLDGLWVANCSDRSRPQWTHARWSSFLWGCKHELTEELRDGYTSDVGVRHG